MHCEQGEIIHAKAPVRFDFGGAPTDVDPFRSDVGGHIVNGTLKICAEVTIIPKSDSKILIHSDNFNTGEEVHSINELTLEGPLKLIKAAVLLTKPTQGFEMHTSVEVPPGSGLGASASLAVALLGALRSLNGETNIDPQELVNGALHMEREMLHNMGGEQDQYAAALGGFHGMEFFQNTVKIRKIDVPQDMIAQLEARSLFCHSGESHVSGQILKQIMDGYASNNQETVNGLHALKRISLETESSLQNGDIYHFGKMMKAVEFAQKSCHPGIIPPPVQEIFSIANRHGGLGGKLAGAGGAGFVYLFCEPGRRDEVAEHLDKQGKLVLPVSFSPDGVVITH